MPQADGSAVDWKIVKIQRQAQMDAELWHRFVYLETRGDEITAAVLVPAGKPATKRLVKARAGGRISA